MPFTFAHPAIVRPLQIICPARLCMPALVAGSIAPDAPYFVHAWNVGALAHTLPGVCVAAFPISLVLLAGFELLRKPVGRLLPARHDQFWSSQQCGISDYKNPTGTFKIFLSLVIGILTHIAWDSFTHSHGAIVSIFPWLAEPVLTNTSVSLPAYQLFQYVSSLIGILVIIVFYRKALPAASENSQDDRRNQLRLFLIAIAAVACGLMLSNAQTLVTTTVSLEATRKFGFLFLVNSIGSLAVILVCVGVVVYKADTLTR